MGKHAPVHRKVTAATSGAYLGSAALLTALTEVQDNASLVEWMPYGLAPVVLSLVPALITFASGWVTRNRPPQDGEE